MILVPLKKGAHKSNKKLFAVAHPEVCFLRDVGHMNAVSLVRTYVHLGSVVEAQGSLIFDIRRRRKQSYLAAKPLAKPVFRDPLVPLSVRFYLFLSLVLSRCSHNIGGWSGLSHGNLPSWQSGCLQLHQYLLPSKLHTKHLTTLDICKLAGAPPPLVLIRLERLRLFGQFSAKGFASLKHLVRSSVGDAGFWLTALQADLEWLVALRPTAAAMDLLQLDLKPLVEGLHDRPALLPSFLRLVWTTVAAEPPSDQFCVSQETQNHGISCPLCNFVCKIRHGQKIEACFFATGAQCGACHKLFPSGATHQTPLAEQSQVFGLPSTTPDSYVCCRTEGSYQTSK